MMVGRYANFLLTTRMPFGFALLGCFSAPSLSDEIPTLLLHHIKTHYPRHLLWGGLADTGTPLKMCFNMAHGTGIEPVFQP